jgi:16S rRNA (cytosine967-C5)-methyltransferase
MGLYQIFWLDRIPHHAAVHETVELARQNGFSSQAGFINAVLRGYLRELEDARRLLAELKTQQPHLGYSHPEWLVARWQQRWGKNQPPVDGMEQHAAAHFAREIPKTDAGKLVEQWRAEKVEYDFVRQIGWKRIWPSNLNHTASEDPDFQQEGSHHPASLLAVRELIRNCRNRARPCAAPGITDPPSPLRQRGPHHRYRH